MKALQKALVESFDLHEQHRELTRKAREKAQAAREADERVRQLQRLARERAPRRAA